MKEEWEQKKRICVVGSDSKIAENLLDYICKKNDKLITISRKKSTKFNSLKHFCTDLSDIKQVITLSNELEKYDLDVFLFFPGYFYAAKFTDLNTHEIIKQLNINLVSAISISLPVIKKMSIQKKGMMLFLGSSSSYSGFKNTSIYCSAKHGLLGFTRSLADEYRDKGIKVSCISPGSVDTKMSIPLQNSQNISTFINPKEISNLMQNLIYNPPLSMWQEEIIIKRLSYQ